MKRNGMCPICWLKKAFTPTKNISSNPSSKSYDNVAALTPPMGWSSWNTFRNNIDEDLIKQTAKAMVDCGLTQDIDISISTTAGIRQCAMPEADCKAT